MWLLLIRQRKCRRRIVCPAVHVLGFGYGVAWPLPLRRESGRGGAVGARRRRTDGAALVAAVTALLLPVLELVALLRLDLEDVTRLERERLVRGHEVAAHLTQAGGLERGRMVGACKDNCGKGCKERRRDGTRGRVRRGVRGRGAGGARRSGTGRGCGRGRTLPRAVLGEVALDPLGAEGVRGDVDGDAEVVARERDLLDAAGVELVQPVRPRKMK